MIPIQPGVNQLKAAVIFPKDSEALFNRNSSRTFGGANVQMFMIARELGKKDGVEAYSLVPNYDTIDFTDSEHFNLVKTFNENDSIIKKIITYHRVIHEIKPDVIIQRGLTLISCFLSVYCRLLGIKFVFMFAHDIESHGRYQRDRKRCLLFPLLMRTVYLAVPQNQYEKDQLKRYDRGATIKILKKGIEIETIRGFISADVPKKYDAVWVARCERWKHPEIFIDLARKNPDFRFLMICSPVDGQKEYYNTVKAEAEGIDNIEFIAFVKNNGIYELLAASTVFCITSDMEGDWPMTVLEAGAVGVPVLSLNLNYGELIDRYGGGVYCGGDRSKMEETLRLMVEDEQLYREMAEGVKGYIQETHDIVRNVGKLVGLVDGGVS